MFEQFSKKFDLYNVIPLGLEVNWKKTRFQSLSDFLPSPGNVVVEDDVDECVSELICMCM